MKAFYVGLISIATFVPILSQAQTQRADADVRAGVLLKKLRLEMPELTKDLGVTISEGHVSKVFLGSKYSRKVLQRSSGLTCAIDEAVTNDWVLPLTDVEAKETRVLTAEELSKEDPDDLGGSYYINLMPGDKVYFYPFEITYGDSSVAVQMDFDSIVLRNRNSRPCTADDWMSEERPTAEDLKKLTSSTCYNAQKRRVYMLCGKDNASVEMTKEDLIEALKGVVNFSK